MKLTVTVIDTSGIQPYIFGSNRLRENIGASYLVAQATDAWVRVTLKELGIADEERAIEEPNQKAELIYAGGGNTVLLFESRELAVQFTRKLSLKILEDAPGIRLIVAHRQVEWGQGLLYQTIQDMMKYDLDEKKRSRPPSSPLLGLSVTQDCNSTRLVAVDSSKNYGFGDYPVSREIATKLDSVRLANNHLRHIIFDSDNEWIIPLNFDDFGRSKGENSYIAVVHIDGNSMGQRFQDHGEGKDDRDYILAMRELSKSVKRAGEEALIQITEELREFCLNSDNNELDLREWQLPFRPLVYGGDDVTFVCDGRLGLTLAARYLEIFEEQEVADGKKLTACAGVCIVKVHYPFARAYRMSEELCASAKQVAKIKQDGNNEPRPESEICSAIDWHIATSGLFGSVGEIREREYQISDSEDQKPQKSLAMRPLSLKADGDNWRTWESFEKITTEFNGDNWEKRSNKVKTLREVLRSGPEKTKEYLKALNEQLPDLPDSINQILCRQDLSETGWHDNRCGYFDPIEAIDFYLPLRGEQ